MKKKRSLIAKAVETALLFTILILGLLVILSERKEILGYKFLVVRSGSMEPAMKTGSLLLIKSNENNEYQEGDIVTFGPVSDAKMLITHRISKVEGKNGELVYTTKGDANDGPDPRKLREEQILGKFFLAIPLIGYVVGFTQTPLGVTLLIVIPATILIYNEILNIKKEIKKRFLKKKE